MRRPGRIHDEQGNSTSAIITTPVCYNGYFENDPGDQGVFLYFGGTGNNGSSCR